MNPRTGDLEDLIPSIFLLFGNYMLHPILGQRDWKPQPIFGFPSSVSTWLRESPREKKGLGPAQVIVISHPSLCQSFLWHPWPSKNHDCLWWLEPTCFCQPLRRRLGNSELQTFKHVFRAKYQPRTNKPWLIVIRRLYRKNMPDLCPLLIMFFLAHAQKIWEHLHTQTFCCIRKYLIAFRTKPQSQGGSGCCRVIWVCAETEATVMALFSNLDCDFK